MRSRQEDTRKQSPTASSPEGGNNPIATHLQINDQFPDIELPDHRNEVTRLSQFTRPGLLDQPLVQERTERKQTLHCV
jgi:hypothetical protein